MVFYKRKLNAGLGRGCWLVVTRNMKHLNKSAFLVDISSISWELVVNKTDNVNVMVEEWLSIFSEVKEKHPPIRETRVSDRNPLWLNRELRLLMKLRDKLKEDAVMYKSSLMDNYRKVRNRVNSRNVLLKQQYFTNKICENKGIMRVPWMILNRFLNKCSKFTNITFIKDGDIEILEKKEVPNTLNSYFLLCGRRAC